MKNWTKQHWAELLVFGAIITILLVCAAPNYTWINTDSDGIHYTYAAKYLVPSHKTSAPLYLLFGHAFLQLPLGTEAWRMVLISILGTLGCAIFIYLIVRRQTGRKSYGCIAAGIYGGSALVISQSTIIETYALLTMLGTGAYYFALKEQWKRCALMLGLGFAIHFLVSLVAIVILTAYKGFRPQFSKWRIANYTPLLITVSFFLFYLYIPISVAVHQAMNMWGNETFATFVRDNASTGGMLIGGLSIWDFPKRVFDTIGILGVCFGLAIVPIIVYLRSLGKKWYKEPLVWLIVLPIVLYATNLAPQTYVYMLPAISFGAIAAGLGLAKWRQKHYYFKYVVLVGLIAMAGFNLNYFDIGRTLDPKLSASQYYYEELDKVPDGQILMAQQGWEWAAAYPYNTDNDRNIIPVYIGTLASPIYQDMLHSWGIKFDIPGEGASLSETQDFIIASILENNDNIWTTLATTPETYGAEIVRVEGHESVLLGTSTPNTLVNPRWSWKPSNPYNIITGAIEVEEWRDIIISNFSMLTFMMLGGIGGIISWIAYMAVVEKRKWSLKKNKVKEVTVS